MIVIETWINYELENATKLKKTPFYENCFVFTDMINELEQPKQYLYYEKVLKWQNRYQINL